MGRIGSIDALRGVVMVIMLLDHIRETFYLHKQVADPVDVTTTEPELFFIRFLSSICAPVFVLLTGMGAWLHGRSHSRAETSAFLLKRGLLLILLEVTVINFSWTGQFPPTTIFLQVIWVIGLAMIALAGLLYMPKLPLLALSAILIAGHHFLEPVSFATGSPWYPIWSVLYDRNWIEISDTMRARTSYPLLPWIGVIALGYGIGPWFSADVEPSIRIRKLTFAGLSALAAFAAIRWLNVYGDAPRLTGVDAGTAMMSFFSLTKYPPSLLFNLSTLGLGALLLAWFERLGDNPSLTRLSVFGAAPMFFYILHLYVLKVIYLICLVLFGANQGSYFGLPSVLTLVPVFIILTVVFYFPTSWFSRLKRRRRDIAWLKYF